MGRELFYCGNCGKRLSGSDVESGEAIRTEDGFLCAGCFAGVKTPPPARAAMPEKSAAPSRKSTARQPLPSGTRRVAAARDQAPGEAPPDRRRALLLGGGLAAGAILVLGIFLFSGGKKEPSPEILPPSPVAVRPPSGAPLGPPPPATPAPAPETPPAPSGEDLRRKFEEAAEDLRRRGGKACGREEFGKAIALWEEARTRFEGEAWKEIVEAEVRAVRQAAAALWKNLLESTAAEGWGALRDRVRSWGMPEIERELEERLRPRDLPPALKVYREAWTRALERAAAGDWEGALKELGNPQEAEVRAEAEVDRALFEKMKALPLPQLERGRAVALKYARTPSEYAEVQGLVVRADEQRVEIEQEGGKRLLVEWADLAPSSRAALLAGGGAEAAVLAALCLVGRDPAAAEGMASREAVPAKYWAWASEGKALPPARDRREYEARDLFHAAELEWRRPEKLGEAIEKYKTILRDYVGTSIAIRNLTHITRRSEAGKEYVLVPSQMKASGPFVRAKVDGTMPAWTLQRDVSGPEERNTYVEAVFYALPGLSYRGWAFLGACCAETFGVYYQTTEGKGRDPKTRKEYVLDPGGGVAMPLDHRIKGLKPTHAAHGGDKRPSRWEWVALPLPASYAAPGLKAFRFLPNQKGFSVSLVVISSVRDRPPDKEEMAALVGPDSEAASAGAELEITGLWVKSRKPYEWYRPKVGDPVFIDRKHTIAVLPPCLAEARALRTSNDDKKAADVPFLRFEVNTDVTVYLAWDLRTPEAPWRKGFKDTGLTFTIRERGGKEEVDRPFRLLARDYPAGPVELGGPCSDRNNAYVVFVVPRR